MQSSNPVSPSDVKQPSRQSRKRRPRNRKKRQNQRQQSSSDSPPQHSQLNAIKQSDLVSEASALERQLAELQTQLQVNHNGSPVAEPGKRALAATTEQISATEDEIQYIRKSLKNIYYKIIMNDITFAVSNRIEDKLWRCVFYANIEDLRVKIRKHTNNEDQAARQRLLRLLVRQIDIAFKFYRDMNQKIKDRHHVDTRTIGVDLFRQNTGSVGDVQVSILLQSNYICLGDLARYRVSQAPSKDKKATENQWRLVKDCYQMAVDVNRLTGKPYSQLALVSLSNGSAIDVVWYYCMSLAMKHPSTVGRDNLRSFYSRIRFSQKECDKTGKQGSTKLISHFVECFLQIHKQTMFGDQTSTDYNAMIGDMQVPNALHATVSHVIAAAAKDTDESLPKHITSTMNVLKTTLTRVVVILIITIWDLGERAKHKDHASQVSSFQSAQLYLLAFGLNLLTNVFKSAHDASANVKEKMAQTKFEQLESLVESSLLPSLSIWCVYMSTNLAAIAQLSTGYGADVRGPSALSPRQRDTERKQVIKMMQSFLSWLISHPMFPDPLDNVLPQTYPVTEDLVLLGTVPLSKFHLTVDYFKENAYHPTDESRPEDRRQVRWARVRDMVRKIAESPAFDFIQYNKAEQKYSVVDENAKRQQQNRFMKALATQRLMDKVSSLEKNVNRMNLSTDKAVELEKKQVYTVVVDVTAFLDSLAKVKKWAGQTLHTHTRSQGSILEVIVPLETIDALDFHKKGTSHTNLQARDSIRYLDQMLGNEKKDSTSSATSFLRTQKLNERVEWTEATAYWIGRETHTPEAETSSESESEDGEQDEIAVSDVESVSSDDLFKARRRQFDEDDDEIDKDSSEDEDDDSASDNEEASSGSEDEDEERPATFEDVPRAYHPVISCMLYYMVKKEEPNQLFLVTNDEKLAWWATMFGDPKTGYRLRAMTVDEWDRTARNLAT